MENYQSPSLLLSLLITTFTLHTMETPPSQVPSLYTLCKNKITTGGGDTYVAQCKDALAKIELIQNEYSEPCAEDFKSSFMHNHMTTFPCTTELFAEQSPSILIPTHHALYGTVGKDIYTWYLSPKTEDDILITGSKTTHLHHGYYKKPQTIKCALISKDGSLLYTGANSGGIKIWNIQSDTINYVTLLAGSFWNKFRSFSENNHGDLCSATVDGEIKIWDIATESRIQKLTNKYSQIATFKLLADTHMIYAGGQDLLFKRSGLIFIYDTRQGNCIDHTDSHHGCITHLAKSKKDVQIYSSSHDKTIQIWDIRNMKKSVHTLKNTGSVRCVEENKDGTLLIACTNKGVYTWDITTENPKIINTITHEPAHCMAQSDDGSQLFIGTNTGIKTLASRCTFDEACTIVNNW